MGREAKREGALPEAAASPLSVRRLEARESGPPALPEGDGALERRGGPTNDGVAGGEAPASGAAHARWFDAIDPTTEPPPPRRDRARIWTAPLVLLAVAVALVGLLRTGILRALVPLALAAAALVLLARRIAALRRSPAEGSGRRPRASNGGRAAPEAARPKRRLSLEGDRLAFHARGQAAPVPLLVTSAPFGVPLLAAPRRDRLVALLSAGSGAFYIGAAFDDPAARRAHAALLDRATIVAADEVGLAAIGPDGEPVALSPDALAGLVDELARRSPGCLDRFFLTDARGAPLTLDGRELRAGDRAFDLGVPLEWRAFVFQETLGQAVALYQGTWVRQGANEVVLVCLLPAITPAPEGEGVALASLDRGALRDLRLMQGAPEDPPPADQRVAVDRLVMLPIRSALDKAPRPAAQPPRARA
ncbi:MAG: IMP dehydrogenase [Polyangiaceae bacterium]|nr:IMP dehydrogenase [Polyangiaceae bacterium]